MRARSTGFTLIEVVVVIGVLGILAALLIPAVQWARESSRSVECVNHLRQIGVALAQHQSQYTYYPSALAARWLVSDNRVRAYPLPRQGFYDLLPFLGEVPLYNALNSRIQDESQIYYDQMVNMTAEQTVVNAFLCPSDSLRGVWPRGPSSYRLNAGTAWSPKWPAGEGDLYLVGAFQPILYSRPQDFSDGLSNTAGASERLLGSQALHPSQVNVSRDFRYGEADGLFEPTSADDLVEFCAALGGMPASFSSDTGRSWDESSFVAGWYNHLAPPNWKSMDCAPGRKDKGGYQVFSVLSARSLHPGRVHVLLMDGAVRPVKEGVNLTVWRSLGTRSGGETLDSGY